MTGVAGGAPLIDKDDTMSHKPNIRESLAIGNPPLIIIPYCCGAKQGRKGITIIRTIVYNKRIGDGSCTYINQLSSDAPECC